MPNTKVVAHTTPYKFVIISFSRIVQSFGEKPTMNPAGQRALNAARRFGRQSSELLRHMADEHRRALLPARTPAAHPTRVPTRRLTRAAAVAQLA